MPRIIKGKDNKRQRSRVRWNGVIIQIHYEEEVTDRVVASGI
jgi:hypothetical protein